MNDPPRNQRVEAKMLVLEPQNIEQVFHEQMDVRYHKKVIVLQILPTIIRYPVHLQVALEKIKKEDAHKKSVPPPPNTNAKKAKVRAVVQALSMNFSMISSSKSLHSSSPSSRLLYQPWNSHCTVLAVLDDVVDEVVLDGCASVSACASASASTKASDSLEGTRKAPIPNSNQGGGSSPSVVSSATTGPSTRAKSQPSCIRDAIQPAVQSRATHSE